MNERIFHFKSIVLSMREPENTFVENIEMKMEEELMMEIHETWATGKRYLDMGLSNFLNFYRKECCFIRIE
jgi:hypothetical protein